jgi:hypothetical protein
VLVEELRSQRVESPPPRWINDPARGIASAS